MERVASIVIHSFTKSSAPEILVGDMWQYAAYVHYVDLHFLLRHSEQET
jgi:hypothetical protein